MPPLLAISLVAGVRLLFQVMGITHLGFLIAASLGCLYQDVSQLYECRIHEFSLFYLSTEHHHLLVFVNLKKTVPHFFGVLCLNQKSFFEMVDNKFLIKQLLIVLGQFLQSLHCPWERPSLA